MTSPASLGDIARFYKGYVPRLKQAGPQWRGPCPIHGGKNPSFAVVPETGAWYCHSKCDRGGSLWELQEILGVEVERATLPRGRKIVATYDYLNEAGEILFQCVRYDPKGFSQRRPGGRGGWVNNLQGVRRVLFRLPTLRDAATVLIAEGEKDVLKLVGLGFVATCNPMGAGKWQPEYSDQLTGQTVVIFPDNDETGEAHAKQVAQLLVGKAASVRLAKVPSGKDVSEWIEGGATRSDIDRAIDSAVVADGVGANADWRRLLLTNARGTPKAVLANAITALRHAPEWAGVLSFDDFAQVTTILENPPWQNAKTGREWSDDDDRLTANWLQHESILVSVETAGLAVQTVAKGNCYHPVRNYLNALKWDRTPRLDGWLSLYLGVDPSPYTAAVGARWLISAVARIYQPGVKADSALILEGTQGLMKSTALRTLAGDFFTDDIAELGTKDAALQTRGAWIIEIPELDSMSRVDVSKIKGFISRSTDRFRPPYGKRLIESPRQCVFAGSVNHTAYLRDETGARRFWPVACERILISELLRDRDQLWAEAVARYRAGERWWLDTAELVMAASEEQAARYESDPWEELVAEWIEERPSVSIEEVLRLCIGKERANWTQADKNRLARCLTSLRVGTVQIGSAFRASVALPARLRDFGRGVPL